MVAPDVVHETYYESPIGYLRLHGTPEKISALEFVDQTPEKIPHAEGVMALCLQQLEQYFQGRRQRFDLPLAPQGTEFQQRVWRYLTKIPFGNVVSYKTVAESIGRRRAFRAVGGANNKNPIAIIIPCHRVIGSDGALIGYGSGLWRKAWLLEHESALPAQGDA